MSREGQDLVSVEISGLAAEELETLRHRHESMRGALRKLEPLVDSEAEPLPVVVLEGE